MNTFNFLIYYEWQGPSKSDPFAREKTATELDDAFREFPGDLHHRLDDPRSTVETSQRSPGAREVSLTVRTTDAREIVMAALTHVLQHWRLFGREI